jgi:hypothetical protein
MPYANSLLLTVVLGLALAACGGLLARKMRMPPLVGYLVAGVAIGPFTPGFIGDANLASQLAEIGVILLMFGVGPAFLDQGSTGGASYCGSGCARTGDRRNDRRRRRRAELGLESCRGAGARIDIVMRKHRCAPARLGRTQRARLGQRPHCGRMAGCRGPCDGSCVGSLTRDDGAVRCRCSWARRVRTASGRPDRSSTRACWCRTW